MDIERCYEILELVPGASLEEVRQAYRDSVSVWHPDRFGERNPRLIKRAEEKIKQINEAYETLVEFCFEQHSGNLGNAECTAGTWQGGSSDWENRQSSGKEKGGVFSSRTEAVAEAGTRLVLTASSQLMKMFRRWIDADGA
jgi:curved DNA-binding protein CbpA